MNRDELPQRTKRFALRIIRLASSLPRNREGYVLGRQILTSAGLNYREALRTSSRRYFLTTVEIATRDADKTLYWLDLLAESELLQDIMRECDQMIRVLPDTARSTRDNV